MTEEILKSVLTLILNCKKKVYIKIKITSVFQLIGLSQFWYSFPFNIFKCAFRNMIILSGLRIQLKGFPTYWN